MEDYLLLIRGEEDPATPEQMQERMQQYGPWRKKWEDAGRYITGAPLTSDTGYQLKRSGAVLTDGPFMEAKEIVGGYILLKANSYEEALEFAKGCPLNQWHDIEVRKLRGLPG